jgi:hypothetical protein
VFLHVNFYVQQNLCMHELFAKFFTHCRHLDENWHNSGGVDEQERFKNVERIDEATLKLAILCDSGKH